MKYFFILTGMLFSFAVYAGDAAPVISQKPLPPGVTMVDGKRFFSLQNARHFTSAGPSAQAVMHHPRPAPYVTHHDRPEASAATSSSSVPPAPQNNNPILSVFAPQNTPVTSAEPIPAVASPAPLAR